jgi:hypothetical protein
VSERELVRKDSKSLSSSLGKTAGIKKELKRATEPDQLQRRRVELEGCRIRAEKIVSHFNDPKLSSDKRQELYLQAQAICGLGTLKGMCLIADMLSWGDKGDVNGKNMVRRTSYFEILWDRLLEIKQATTVQFTERERELYAENLPEGAEIPDGLGAVQALIAMDQKLTGLYAMMHKLGLHTNPEMFKVVDKNGVTQTEDEFAVTPGTFFEGMDDDEIDSDDDMKADDPNAITEEESDKIKRDAEEADDIGDDDEEDPETDLDIEEEA